MRHTLDELLAVVYRFYHRAKNPDDRGSYPYTEQLVAARRQAGSEVPYERWESVLEHLNARFPGHTFINRSLHLPAGHFDACYSSWLFLPPLPGYDRRHLGFLISFLVPYYVIYTAHFIYRDRHDPVNKGHSEREKFAFTFAADEQPFVREIMREIETTYSGHEPMPPEVGNVIVPDVFVGNQPLGQAKLFHCLFMDDW